MAAKKRAVKQRPLLNTVARTLGHAAGTLTKVTQEFADNLSAMPESIAAKVRHAAKIGESAVSARGRRHTRKKISRAVRRGKTKVAAAVAGTKRRLPRQKAPRRKTRASNLKK
jgi:hypothetical protein